MRRSLPCVWGTLLFLSPQYLTSLGEWPLVHSVPVVSQGMNTWPKSDQSVYSIFLVIVTVSRMGTWQTGPMRGNPRFSQDPEMKRISISPGVITMDRGTPQLPLARMNILKNEANTKGNRSERKRKSWWYYLSPWIRPYLRPIILDPPVIWTKSFFFFFASTTYNPSGGRQGKRGKIITYNEIIIFSEYLW